MIRSLFIPDIIGSYYVFGQRLVACELTKTHVRVAVTKASGKTRTIEHIGEIPIDDDPTKSYQERAAQALMVAFSSVGRYNQLSVVVPANSVIFKELRLPFTSLEKIKLVLPFELESLLPFALSQAAVDCLLTNAQPDYSVVGAVAIRQDILAEHIAPFEIAGLQPQRVTVDMIELYALYRALYQQNQRPNTLLMYVGPESTRLAVIVHHQLKAIRYLAQGITSLAELIGSDFEHTAQISEEAVRQAAPFFRDTLFTLESFSARATEDEKINEILLMGAGSEIKGLPALIEQSTGLHCQPLVTQAIVQHNIGTLKGNHGLPNKAIICMTTSLSLGASEDFNLYRAPELVARQSLITKQLIAAGSLILLILGCLLASGFFVSRQLKREMQASEKEAVMRLKKEFPSLATRVKSSSLDLITKAARLEVAREKTIWFALSTQNRTSFLRYLQELSTRIDVDGLGLLFTRFTLTEDTLTLEGQVKDFEALKQLEEDLRRSKLFTSVPRLQGLKFEAKLPLAKEFGES